MYIKDGKFMVEFSAYAETHYCKSFYKKYKEKAWSETRKTILETLSRVARVQGTSLLDVLLYAQEEECGIFKYDFKIAGTPTSPKSSGNRVIFFLCHKKMEVTILLVYGKNHCDKAHSETQWIYAQIREYFPEYSRYVSGSSKKK
jgi:hypothetical protein